MGGGDGGLQAERREGAWEGRGVGELGREAGKGKYSCLKMNQFGFNNS